MSRSDNPFLPHADKYRQTETTEYSTHYKDIKCCTIHSCSLTSGAESTTCVSDCSAAWSLTSCEKVNCLYSSKQCRTKTPIINEILHIILCDRIRKKLYRLQAVSIQIIALCFIPGFVEKMDPLVINGKARTKGRKLLLYMIHTPAMTMHAGSGQGWILQWG